jgi:hypothetical protein
MFAPCLSNIGSFTWMQISSAAQNSLSQSLEVRISIGSVTIGFQAIVRANSSVTQQLLSKSMEEDLV